MTKRVEYSERALRNLEGIKAYIAQDNPAAALQVVTALTSAANDLSTHPMLGNPWKREGTRKLVIPKYPYVIIYRLTASAVFVLAVAHQSMKMA